MSVLIILRSPQAGCAGQRVSCPISEQNPSVAEAHITLKKHAFFICTCFEVVRLPRSFGQHPELSLHVIGHGFLTFFRTFHNIRERLISSDMRKVNTDDDEGSND